MKDNHSFGHKTWNCKIGCFLCDQFVAQQADNFGMCAFEQPPRVVPRGKPWERKQISSEKAKILT